LLSIVERPRNSVFEDDSTPAALRAKVVSYALEPYKVFVERLVV